MGDNSVSSITPDTDEAPAPLVIARTSSPRYLADHCGRISAEGVIWEWDEKDKEEGVAIVSLPASDSASDPLRLVFLPHVAELTFSLAGLPDMPNPRSTGDLFDCVLPRITLPEDLDDAETQLLGFIGVSAQLAWESNNRWDDHPPDNMPEGHTFRDTTPQALLDWYLDHTPGAWVRYDPDGLVLHLNEEESDWWGRLKEGFQRILQML